jgi:hypothetical protein
MDFKPMPANQIPSSSCRWTVVSSSWGYCRCACCRRLKTCGLHDTPCLCLPFPPSRRVLCNTSHIGIGLHHDLQHRTHSAHTPLGHRVLFGLFRSVKCAIGRNLRHTMCSPSSDLFAQQACTHTALLGHRVLFGLFRSIKLAIG